MSARTATVDMGEIARIGGRELNPDIAAALHILEINGLIKYEFSK